MTRSCDTCRHFHATPEDGHAEAYEDEDLGRIGQCRASGPRFSDSWLSRWPRVTSKDWCGKFEDIQGFIDKRRPK